MEKKLCPKCNTEKILSEWRLRKDGYYSSLCKKCELGYGYEWGKNNKDKVKLKSQRYRLKMLKRKEGQITVPFSKICSKCHIEKLSSEFSVERGTKIGIRPYCKECGNKTTKKYRDCHKKQCQQMTKNWKIKNSKHFKLMRNEWERKKRQENIHYRLLSGLRTRMRHLIKKTKSDKTISLVGCDINYLKGYLEGKFQDGMSWENYGLFGWHIDHIIPCSNFDLTDPEQQKKCFNYKNLQPLWAKENLRKGANLCLQV